MVVDVGPHWPQYGSLLEYRLLSSTSFQAAYVAGKVPRFFSAHETLRSIYSNSSLTDNVGPPAIYLSISRRLLDSVCPCTRSQLQTAH